MTKLELYKQICELLPPEKEIKSGIEEQYTLIAKEIKRKDSNSFQADMMFGLFIDCCMRIGIAITINAIADKVMLSDIDYELLEEIKKQIEINIHNFENITNRPSFFLIVIWSCNRLHNFFNIF